MTNDYKKELLNYISGNITVGSEQDTEYKNNQYQVNYLKTKLNDLGITPTFYKILSNEITSNFLLYGGYLNEDNNTYYGFIAILNSNGEVLDILTEYDSGTKFSYFQCLEYDEDNNIYGLDLVGSNYRFIMLNNVAVKTSTGFTCKLRQSYYIPSGANYHIPNSFLQGTSYVKKVNGKATYYMFGSNNSKVMLIEFKINVGSTNEWNYYEGTSLSGLAINYCDFILEIQNDTTTSYIYYVVGSTTLYCDYFNGSSLTRQNTYTYNNNVIKDIRVLSDTQCYSIIRVLDNDLSQWVIELYKIENEINSLIETVTNDSFIIDNSYLSLIGGNLFIKTIGTALGGGYTVLYGVYDGNKYIQSNYPVGVYGTPYITDISCVVQKSFSLYKCYTQIGEALFTSPIVIYDNQYSGSSYEDYNSLVPLHSELYSNGSIVFARDLYNKQIYQNNTVSIVNVPNNYLNDISIQPNNLISATITELVSSTDPITKNIYENVFINFNNKLQVINEDTSTIYNLVAYYINQNINIGTQDNYENTYIGKLKVNKGTDTFITNVTWNVIDDTHKETTFGIVVDQQISSIELLSNDETTTYLTLDTSNLEVGKIYTINQKLRIE